MNIYLIIVIFITIGFITITIIITTIVITVIIVIIIIIIVTLISVESTKYKKIYKSTNQLYLALWPNFDLYEGHFSKNLST